MRENPFLPHSFVCANHSHSYCHLQRRRAKTSTERAAQNHPRQSAAVGECDAPCCCRGGCAPACGRPSCRTESTTRFRPCALAGGAVALRRQTPRSHCSRCTTWSRTAMRATCCSLLSAAHSAAHRRRRRRLAVDREGHLRSTRAADHSAPRGALGSTSQHHIPYKSAGHRFRHKHDTSLFAMAGDFTYHDGDACCCCSRRRRCRRRCCCCCCCCCWCWRSRRSCS